MATPGILFRVFLFHFEKILCYFGLFWVFQLIPAEIQDFAGMKFVLKKKKKKNLKTKTNLHFVHQKTSKEKKMKRKEMNKGTCTINYKFI